MVNDIEETSARSIEASHLSEGFYGTTSGTWIGAVSAGSPVIKVQQSSSVPQHQSGQPWRRLPDQGSHRCHPRLMRRAHKLRGEKRWR